MIEGIKGSLSFYLARVVTNIGRVPGRHVPSSSSSSVDPTVLVLRIARSSKAADPRSPSRDLSRPTCPLGCSPAGHPFELHGRNLGDLINPHMDAYRCG